MLLDLLSTNPDWMRTIVRLIFGRRLLRSRGWSGGPGLKETMRTMHETLGLPASVSFVATLAEFPWRPGPCWAVSRPWHRHGYVSSVWRQERPRYEYHLLAIALAAVIIVRDSGATSLDRLLYISFA
jgi:hypothetical protein